MQSASEKLPSSEVMEHATLVALDRLGGKATVREIDSLAADVIGLNPVQRTIAHGVGSQLEFEYRLAWARTRLKARGLILSEGRGLWRKADAGTEEAKIPSTETLTKATVEALHLLGGSATISEIAFKVAEILRLNSAQQTALHGAGPATELEYRLAWARTRLKAEGALARQGRGVWALTAGAPRVAGDVRKGADKVDGNTPPGRVASRLTVARRKNDAVDGLSASVFYNFFEKYLQGQDRPLFEAVFPKVLTSLGLWFRPSLYGRLPLLLPHAARSKGSRGDASKGVPDQWGSPDEAGYFRDDNSLVKSLPKGLVISGPNETYHGRRMGNGFVACHVWRKLSDSSDAHGGAYDPYTYSFVPNLVWLPRSVAGLTDREGSFAQRYLQALSMKIYREQPVAPGMQRFVRAAWERLPPPPGVPAASLPQIQDLNFFQETDAFVAERRGVVESLCEALPGLIRGEPPAQKIVSTRYGQGLLEVEPARLDQLYEMLHAYAEAITRS